MSTKREENNGKESKEPDYDGKDQLEEESVGLDEEQTTNQVF